MYIRVSLLRRGPRPARRWASRCPALDDAATGRHHHRWWSSCPRRRVQQHDDHRNRVGKEAKRNSCSERQPLPRAAGMHSLLHSHDHQELSLGGAGPPAAPATLKSAAPLAAPAGVPPPPVLPVAPPFCAALPPSAATRACAYVHCTGMSCLHAAAPPALVHFSKLLTRHDKRQQEGLPRRTATARRALCSAALRLCSVAFCTTFQERKSGYE